jgi:hypothetical protein
MAPLYAIVVALAVGASADPGRPENPFLLGLRARLAAAYVERPDERLFDIADQRERALSNGADAAAFAQLEQLVEEARAFQLGRRQEETQDAYNRSLMDVARRLGARTDRVLAAYGRRVRPDGAGTPTEVAARIRVLSRVNEQLGREGQRRMAMRLRGYRNALEDMTVRDGGTITGSGAATSYLAYRSAGPTARGATDASPLVAASYQTASLVAFTPEQFRALNAQPAAQHAPIRATTDDTPAPPPQPESGIRWAYNTVLNYIDNSRVGRMAQSLASSARVLYGRCYEFVKNAMISAGFFPSHVRSSTEVEEVGIGSGSAYMFAQLTEQQLRERRLRLVNPSTIPWAPQNDNLEGYILVWAPRCNGEEIGRNGRGAHPEHGHIEAIVSRRRIDSMPRHVRANLSGILQPSDLVAVSDHATGRNVDVLRRYSAEPQIMSRPFNHRGHQVRLPCLTVLAPVNAP